MERRIMKTLTHKSRRFASNADIPKTYRELCQLYLPRPIHNDAEDAEATAMMNALAVFTRLNAEQRDYLDVLTEFVDEFDKGKKVRWPKISGLDALKHLLEEHEMSAADLSRMLHTSRNLGAMILRGERKLTLNHVRTLARHFGVSADVFLT
jgi:HTH-type transcriptional regulator/antitoxin HigA